MADQSPGTLAMGTWALPQLYDQTQEPVMIEREQMGELELHQDTLSWAASATLH
jgi:hypothetical protein